MFPRNAATPPEIDLGQILQLSDGAIQTTGASVRVKIGTGAWGSGAGTLSCDATSGIWTYAPTQAETNAAYFIVGVYKASCTALSKTIVTSISATAGYAGLDWANILSPTTTVNLSGTTIRTATDVETDTQDIQSRLPAALVGGRIDANMGAISADSVAADNAESFFDGTGYAGTNNVIPTVTTLTDKTGFSLSQSFPANFASLAITAGGAVTVGTNNDKTGYSLSQSFPANFASMNLDVSGRVLLQATQTGVTIPTVTTVTNRVSANTDQIAGVAVSTSTAQIGVNVVNAGGTAWGSGAITAGSIASNAITSAKIATDAIGASQLAAGCITSSELAASAITAIQSGLATTANVLAVETDTQDIQARLPAALVGGRIDANMGAISSDSIAADNAEAFFDGTGYAGTGNTIPTVTAVGSVSGAVGSVTGNVGGNVVGSVGSVTGAVGSVTSAVTVGTNNDKTGYSLSTVAIQAIWDALTSALSTAGSVGKLIVDNINATISSRATQASVDAIDDFVDTEVAAIKATTDKLDTTVELDGAVYRFTTNALEQAPAGGGGGGTDWTTDERTAIRSILGIPGSGTTPTDPTVGILDTIRDSAVDIQSRLPATLDSGNMRSSVQSMATNVLTASALATDAVQEIQSGLALESTLAVVAGYLDTEIAAIKLVTDKVNGMLVLDGSVYQYTANALELGPSGSGSVSVYPTQLQAEDRNVEGPIRIYTGEYGEQYFHALDSNLDPIDLTGITLELRFGDSIQKNILYTAKTSDGTIVVSNQNKVTFTKSLNFTRFEMSTLRYSLRDMDEGAKVLLTGPVKLSWAP